MKRENKFRELYPKGMKCENKFSEIRQKISEIRRYIPNQKIYQINLNILD